MLAPLLSPVPAINIEFCPEQSPVKEPSSPFDNIMFSVDSPHEDYRSRHLLPPPIHSPKRAITQPVPTPKGLDSARFEALRLATKAIYGSSTQDLRKSIAMKVHQSKRLERRNLFLSKIEALPSPTAASLPVTPPESPAVFHFTLPSPGLISPLAMFETLENESEPRPVRVEQVDFRARARKEAEALAALTGNLKQSLQVHGLPAPPQKRTRPAKPLPSLDQISKRLGGNVTITRSGSPVSRLPAFLQRASPPPAAVAAPAQSPAPVAAPAPVQVQVAAPAPALEQQQSAACASPTPRYAFTPTNLHGPIARPTTKGTKATGPLPRPGSVALPGPRIASTRAPTPLTAQALDALADRAERGAEMMERLQRRFSAPARLNGQRNIRSLARPIGGF